MKKLTKQFFLTIISREGFLALFYSFLFGYFIIFWLFKIGFKSFEMNSFISTNAFANPTTYKYYLISLIIGQIVLFILFLRQILLVKIPNFFRYCLYIMLVFLAITLIDFQNIYANYLKLLLLSVDLTALFYLIFAAELPKITPRKSQKLIILIIIIFAILYSALSIVRHNHYGSHAYDLGLYSQMVYNYSQTGLPDCSIRGLTNCWGDHFDPILLAISPLYWIWASPKVLLGLQAVMLAIAAWPLYLVASRKLANAQAAIFVVVGYLSFIGIWRAVDFDFHPIVFFPALFLFIYYFMQSRRYFLYWLFFALALLVKEDIPVYLFFFSVYLIFFRKLYKVGGISLLISLIWYIFTTKIIIPHFAVNGFEYFQFSALGASPLEALKNVITNPLYVFYLATDNLAKQTTILSLLASFGFLAFFAPIFIFLALPMLAEQVLFDANTHWQINFHYSVAIAPILALGSVYGIKYLSQKIRFQGTIIILSILMMFSSLVISLWEKTPALNFLRVAFYQKKEWMINIDQVIKSIPKGAEVVAQHNIVPHLSERKLIAPYPVNRGERLKSPEFYVFSVNGFSFPISTKKDQIQILEDLLNNQEYGIYQIYGDAFVFRKNYSNNELTIKARDYLARQ